MAVVALYVVALWVPGLLLGRLAGMRDWTLAAAAPLVTYAVAGLAGPACAALGIRWAPTSAVVLLLGLVVLAAAVGYAARRSARAEERAARTSRLGARLTAPLRVLRRWATRRSAARPAKPARPAEPTRGAARWWAARRVARTEPVPEEPPWTGRAHRRVAAVLAGVAVLGAVVIWAGVGRLSAVPQDWDAAFHANGIRWIAETGDSSLVAMGSVNWFENGVQVFYPNAYHLMAALVLSLTGTDVPTVLNAHTVLLPGMGALVVVALVRRFGGRPALAAGAAASSVAITALYDMLWRGPLLPFTTGAVLMPVIAVLLVDLLDAGRRRSRVRCGLLFVVGVAGMIALTPTMLFSAMLFVLPAVVQRWAGRPRSLRREPLLILVAGLVTAAATLPQLVASLGSAGGEPFDWPAELSPGEAVGELLTLSHGEGHAQWVLVAAAALGLLGVRRLRRLRWLVVSGVLFATLFVLTASSDAVWVNTLTRPWWNDRWRLIGLCVAPVAVLAGHGLVELQRWGTAAVIAGSRFTDDRLRRHPARVATTVGTAVAVLFLGLSGGLYAAQNIDRMRMSAPDGPVVSSREIEAMRVLATLVPPGQRVLNDRGDGSAWMYAIAGVLPVAGHYNASQIGPDAALLAARFNRYATEAEVRAAVARLGVTYVMLGEGYVREEYVRAPGLTGLDRMRWLEEVYRNRDAVVYRIRPDPPSRQ